MPLTDEQVMIATSLLDSNKDESTCNLQSRSCVLFNSDFNCIGSGNTTSLTFGVNCYTNGHVLKNGHCIRPVHCEIKALNSLYHNKDNKDIKSVPYAAFISTKPCLYCLKALVCFGFIEIYWFNDDIHDYTNEELKDILPEYVSFGQIDKQY